MSNCIITVIILQSIVIANGVIHYLEHFLHMLPSTPK